MNFAGVGLRELNEWRIGMCDIEKKNDISIFWDFFRRRYFVSVFVECVIVLISDYCAQLQFMIFFIFCELSSHQ